MDNVRYVKTGEGENVRFHQLGAVDNVRYVKTGEGENVRPVKKMRWQMTAYALIGEGENVRGGKCPPFPSMSRWAIRRSMMKDELEMPKIEMVS